MENDTISDNIAGQLASFGIEFERYTAFPLCAIGIKAGAGVNDVAVVLCWASPLPATLRKEFTRLAIRALERSLHGS